MQETASDEAAHAAGQILGAVSHDLRSPLGAIVLWARILRHAPAEGPETAAAIDMIERSAESLRAQLDELADAGAILSREVRLSREPVDLRALLAHAAEAMRADAAGRNVAIGAPPPGPAAVVEADAGRMRQVLDHVLGGLVHDAVAGAIVECRVDVQSGRASCHLEIAGPEPSLPGPTLALSHRSRMLMLIARALVTLHGGQLRIEEGRRLAASVTLPLSPSPSSR